MAEVMIEELAEPELRELFLRERRRAGRVEDFVSVPLQNYWKRSPARVVTMPSVRLKYIECGIMATDGAPLEEMRNLMLSGRAPLELHADFQPVEQGLHVALWAVVRGIVALPVSADIPQSR